MDPTRVMTRVGYSIVANDPKGPLAMVGNRFSMNLGIGRWSVSGKFEIASKVGEQAGTGFETELNDFKFSVLNAFLVRAFLGHFYSVGYFFVFEPKTIFDLEDTKTGWIISPTVGKAIGKGFNLIGLAEIVLTDNLNTNRGSLYEVGFNKNFNK